MTDNGQPSLVPAGERSAIHSAAALLSRFLITDFSTLTPTIDEIQDLLGDSVPVTGSKSWTLRPDVRADLLQQLAREDRLSRAIGEVEATIAGAREDPLWRALARFDREGSNALEGMSADDLSAVGPALDALADLPSRFPGRLEVERRLNFLQLLAPFERLVGTHFCGRQEEQQRLRDYTGAFAPQPAAAARKPFLIHGVGGVGKSTLLAKFILDHARAARADRFPFAYLDYDRAAVAVDEPATILYESVQQIAVQFPNAAADADALRRRWRQLLTSEPRSPARARARIARDFMRFVSALDADRRLPVLLVLDTVEEVQYRGHIPILASFLAHLSKHLPRLRVVMAGRVAVPELAVDDRIELVAFDHDAAVAFLRSVGVADEAIASAIARAVGGTPLTLRLAAALFCLEGTSDGAQPFPFLSFAEARRSAIDAQLFRRILEHIHVADVRKLAHPGLVLRRITAEVIQEVLAAPCGVDVPNAKRARELFEELQREIALVSPGEEEGVVVHRPDVRKLMLEPLRETRPRQVLEIHLNAVQYYSRFENDPILRAEEIYHRLSLGQGFDLIAERFMQGVKPYLRNAMDELPAPEMAFLAPRVDYVLPADKLAQAEQEQWERTAVQRIDQAMRQNDVDAALRVLGERTQRSGATMLRVREAMVHAAAGQLPDAEEAIREAPESYVLAGNPRGAFEALLLHAIIAHRRGDVRLALERLARAEEITRAGGDELQILQVLATRAEIEPPDDDAVTRIRESAARVEQSDDWSHDPLLLVRVAAIAGARDIALVIRAVELGGTLDLSPDEERTLERTLARTASGPGAAEPSFRSRLLYALRDAGGPRAAVAEEVARALSGVARRRTQPWFSDVRLGPRLTLSADEIAARLEGVTLDQLEDVLERGFNRSVRALSSGRDADSVLRDVLQASARQGWTLELLGALLLTADEMPQLLASLEGLGIGIRIREATAELMSHLAANRPAIAALSHRVCRVESRRALVATGFLIAPSFVLTAAPLPEAPLMVRFDYGEIDGQPWHSGVECGVKEVRPLSGGAVLLHLDRAVGNEPVGGARAGRNAPIRRVVRLDSAVALVPESRSFWLWTENDGLHLAGGNIAAAQANASCAGAPCFDEQFRLAGLHGGASVLPIVTLREGLGEDDRKLLDRDLNGLQLSGPELRELRDAILDRFSLPAFDRVLSDYLSIQRERIATGNGFEDIAFITLEKVMQRGLLGALLLALAAEQPGERRFEKLVQRHLGG